MEDKPSTEPPQPTAQETLQVVPQVSALVPEPKHKRQIRKLVEIVGEDSILIRLVSFLWKEIHAMKEGWAAFLIMALVVAFVTYTVAADLVFDPKIDSLNKTLQTSDGAKKEAERDRDKYQIEAQNADNALAPWKELANSEFPGEPISESLNLLLVKVDSIQKAMQPPSIKDKFRASLDKIDPHFLQLLAKGQTRFQGFLPVYEISQLQELANEEGASQFIQIQGGNNLELSPTGDQNSYFLVLDKSLVQTNAPPLTPDK